MLDNNLHVYTYVQCALNAPVCMYVRMCAVHILCLIINTIILLYCLISVHLCTKARILVSDIWFCFKGHELGFDYNPAFMKSTIFADHRISQVFLHFKNLIYSEELMAKLKNSKTFNFKLFFRKDKSFIFIRNSDLRNMHLMN